MTKSSSGKQSRVARASKPAKIRSAKTTPAKTTVVKSRHVKTTPAKAGSGGTKPAPAKATQGRKTTARKSAPVRAKPPVKAKKAETPKKKAALTPSKLNPRAAPRSARPASEVRLVQGEGWTAVEVPDGIALHDPGFRYVHYLNATAAVIYLLCERPAAPKEIVNAVVALFKLESAAEPEIQDFIGNLRDLGILKSAA